MEKTGEHPSALIQLTTCLQPKNEKKKNQTFYVYPIHLTIHSVSFYVK